MSSLVVIGVGGGIAAYKVASLVRSFTERGYDVRVIPTAAALHFVGEATWSALSGQPAPSTVWDDVHEVPHVRIGQRADLVIVAPATADLMAKAAHGLADDLLTSTLLTARCPVVFAPAMHTEMWLHPATQANVRSLRERGNVVIDPAVGRLTGADAGAGRMPEPQEIFACCEGLLGRGMLVHDLVGRHVVVSAGGTREYLDPVRFLGNRSSGKQGYALARTAVVRGARVTLVAANTQLSPPAGVKVVDVVSAADMLAAMTVAVTDADAIVMAAAVADFRPVAKSEHKIKKTDAESAPALDLERTTDILAMLATSRSRPGQVVVGFAAETENVLANGRAKLARKGCDLLIVNRVGDNEGFEVEDNAAVILAADGSSVEVPYGPKDGLAGVIWDLVVERLPPASE